MWQETNQHEQSLRAQMSDVAFRIDCKCLLVDHGAILARAACEYAPIIQDSERAGIHAIHVAGSQNGWERPENNNELLLLSKRTRLKIRIDSDKTNQLISNLAGVTLNVAGSSLHIVSGQARLLRPSSTLFSRYTYFEELDENSPETLFIDHVVKQCKHHAFSPTKILCGKQYTVNTANGPRLTRSVLLADVPAVESLTLQDNGLGDGRTMGCGLLIPHKDTGAVNEH